MIDYSGSKPRYYDKYGVEITDGCTIKFPNGEVKEVCETDRGHLGTDATNPSWIARGLAAPFEYGVYPLEDSETNECVVVDGWYMYD